MMASETLGLDGLFKELTWNGTVITSIFGLPPITGTPVQQEFQRPMQRRVDRLYRLVDGSLLNVEHQSSLKDVDGLARRTADYHLMIAGQFPGTIIRQVVIFIATDRKRDVKVPASIGLGRLDENGHGFHFKVPVCDIAKVPIHVFEASGNLDDLLLGLLSHGFETPGYLDRVKGAINVLSGEGRALALEKLVAVRALVDNGEHGKDGDFDMMIDEVKDRPFVQRIVEVAGQDRMATERRKALAGVIDARARKLDLSPPPDLVDLLVAYADESQLMAMIDDVDDMTDVVEFISSHGVDLPGYDS